MIENAPARSMTNSVHFFDHPFSEQEYAVEKTDCSFVALKFQTWPLPYRQRWTREIA